MAKKKTIIEEQIPDNTIPGMTDGEFSFSSDTDSDLLLEKIKGQYGSSRVHIKVYKIVAGHTPIFQFKSEEHVDEEQLQQYGGGKYALRFFVDGVHKHTEHLEVAEKPTIPYAQPTSAADIQIQMLREQSQMNRELLMAVIGRATPMSQPTPMAEIASIWGLIHGTNPANGNGNGGIDKILEVLKIGMELGGKGGDMDWKSALIGAAKELAPAVLTVVNKGIPVALPNGNGNGNPTTMNTDQLLKHGLALIKPRILSGLPVGLVLDWIVANANDPQYQGFLALAIQKDFQDLVNADNEVANEPFNSWLRQFLSGLKEHFKDNTSTDEEPEPIL